MSKYSTHLLVCGGTGCHDSESDAIVCNLRDELEAKGLMDSVQVIMTVFWFLRKGPMVKVLPDNTFYVQVKPEDAQAIVEEHVIKGRKSNRLSCTKDPVSQEPVSDSKTYWRYSKSRS